MKIEEIIMANATSVLLMVILLVSRFINRRKRRTEDKFFTVLACIGISATVLETIAFFVDGVSGGFASFVNVLSNALIYCCTATISVIWVWYVDSYLNHDAKRIKTVLLPFVIVWTILIVMIIVNIFVPFLFKINESNEYERMPLGYIYYVFLFVSFIVSAIIYVKNRIRHGQNQFFPIWMFLLPVVIGCVIQALWYGIATAWLGCGIGLTSIYLDIQSRYSLIDDLTRVYNRAFIEHKLIVYRHNSNYAYGGIMLDIDSFKQINDTHGHSVGDDALRKAAKMLMDSAYRNTLVCRFAGDEFIILFRVPLIQKDELESKMVSLENLIREKAEIFNSSSDAPYKIMFSIGHAIYDTNLRDDEFFRQMDLAMYREKKAHHNSKKYNRDTL